MFCYRRFLFRNFLHFSFFCLHRLSFLEFNYHFYALIDQHLIVTLAFACMRYFTMWVYKFAWSLTGHYPDFISTCLWPAFKILVVRLPGTTKTYTGQPKIMLMLFGGQPKIYSQKSPFTFCQTWHRRKM